MLSNQSTHTIISFFRDKVLHFAPTDDIYSFLMFWFQMTFNISSPHSLHHFLYPHSKIFSYFDKVFNSISCYIYNTIEGFKDNINDAHITHKPLHYSSTYFLSSQSPHLNFLYRYGSTASSQTCLRPTNIFTKTSATSFISLIWLITSTKFSMPNFCCPLQTASTTLSTSSTPDPLSEQ